MPAGAVATRTQANKCPYGRARSPRPDYTFRVAGKSAGHWDATTDTLDDEGVSKRLARSTVSSQRTSRGRSRRTRVKRLLGTALALSACGFGPLAALGAALGWMTRRQLLRMANHAHGMRWANAAIGVGILNSMLWVCAWTWLTLDPPMQTAGASREHRASSFVSQPMALPNYRDFPELETLPAAAVDEAAADSTWTRFIGRVLLTDVGNGVRSLSVSLEELSALAHRRRRVPLLWLVDSECEPCNDMAQSLDTAPLQRAFGGVLLIRVDAEQFEAELVELRILETPLPAFALLTREGRPMDLIHAGEWRSLDVKRMAPLLETFVRRRTFERRFPWRGGPRPDETPI